jgi:hypothetical protein
MTRMSRIRRAGRSEGRARPRGTALARRGGMNPRASRLLLLAVVWLLPLGCGKSKSLTPDGSTSSGDGPACQGQPVTCVGGGPSGTGVGCNSTAQPGSCVAGQWTCPKGMVDERDCTCGEPGLSCARQTCTPDGPVCLDAGVDADTSVDGETCGDAPNPFCGQVVGGTGDIVICGDAFSTADCVGGRWTCAPGKVEASLCTCSEFHPPGCGICTTHGWACPDGGVDAGPGDVRSDASTVDASSCDPACAPQTTSAFCLADEVTWLCQGTFHAQTFATCRDPGTDAPRFCCARDFVPACP